LGNVWVKDILNSGNNFYRSVGLLYVVSKREKDINKVFSGYTTIDLCICHIKHIPVDIKL
jgi:hypothetical protein